MKQAALVDGLAFDAFPLEQDCLASAEVDVSRGQIVDALVIPSVVVMLDEGLDLGFEVAGQIIIFAQDAVLKRLMPALDLPLGLGWQGAPRMWAIFRSSSQSTRSAAT